MLRCFAGVWRCLEVFFCYLVVGFCMGGGVWKKKSFSTRKRGHYCTLLCNTTLPASFYCLQYCAIYYPTTPFIAIKYWQYLIRATCSCTPHHTVAPPLSRSESIYGSASRSRSGYRATDSTCPPCLAQDESAQPSGPVAPCSAERRASPPGQLRRRTMRHLDSPPRHDLSLYSYYSISPPPGIVLINRLFEYVYIVLISAKNAASWSAASSHHAQSRPSPQVFFLIYGGVVFLYYCLHILPSLQVSCVLCIFMYVCKPRTPPPRQLRRRTMRNLDTPPRYVLSFLFTARSPTFPSCTG